MDCRTFHRKMEDYLEDGLDFAGRFGMERHAQQCISCGKELADAQQLKKMVSALQRVKAPPSFESALLKEIASHKAHSRFWSLRKYWIYGFEWMSWRKMALASFAMAVFAFGIFYPHQQPTVDQIAGPPAVNLEPSRSALPEKVERASAEQKKEAPASNKNTVAEQPKLAKTPPLELLSAEQEDPLNLDVKDMDYVEYLLPGPDNYAVPVRLPKKIPMRYSQMSEEYFIRNVSH